MPSAPRSVHRSRSPSTASAKIGVTVHGVLVPPSLTEWLVLPLKTGPEAPNARGVPPGTIVGAVLAGVAVLGLLGATAWYRYLLKKRRAETTTGATLADGTKAVTPKEEPQTAL